MTRLFTNIARLVNIREENRLLHGKGLANLPVLENAWIQVEGDTIAGYGRMEDLPVMGGNSSFSLAESSRVDTQEATVLPCWCDSHSHLVFAGSREEEFVDKIRGLSYESINARGGGILNSARRLNETTEDELYRQARERLTEIAKLGTGAVEIKSGYGLTVESELRMLRVIKKLKMHSPLLIRSSFLGAHTYPLEYRDNHQGYIDLIIGKMLPAIADENLADYIDVFCEKGFFSAAETRTICEAGMQFGLRPKLHVNQLNSIGGIETGIELGAVSLDHLESLSQEEIRLLGKASIESGWPGVCTLLPTAAFFLRLPFQPARSLIDSGCAVALASDFNPGSSPSGNMNLVVSMACIQMKMLPQEAINAATLNGAFAMGLEKEAGSITTGKKANLIFTKKIPSLAYLPYSFGSNCIEKVLIGGEWVKSDRNPA